MRWTQTPEERFWAKVKATEKCLEWQACKNSQGYGQIYYEQRVQLAHRVAWKLSGRLIADTQKLLHECDNPACVTVAHLKPGTQADNIRDMHARNRARKRSDSRSGERRIYCQGKRYEVSLRIDGKNKSIGSYASLAEAVVARDLALAGR